MKTQISNKMEINRCHLECAVLVQEQRKAESIRINGKVKNGERLTSKELQFLFGNDVPMVLTVELKQAS